jgi:hypothetical protein
VIVPDLNLLLYAIDDSSPQHERARVWLSDVMSGTETVAFAWTVLLGFIRLATNPRVFADPLAAGDAIEIASGWLEQPNSTLVNPTDRHLAVLQELLAPLGTAGNLATDGHLAALAIEHGAEIHSADTDFARFPGLRWTNPLVAAD